MDHITKVAHQDILALERRQELRLKRRLAALKECMETCGTSPNHCFNCPQWHKVQGGA